MFFQLELKLENFRFNSKVNDWIEIELFFEISISIDLDDLFFEISISRD